MMMTMMMMMMILTSDRYHGSVFALVVVENSNVIVG